MGAVGVGGMYAAVAEGVRGAAVVAVCRVVVAVGVWGMCAVVAVGVGGGGAVVALGAVCVWGGGGGGGVCVWGERRWR